LHDAAHLGVCAQLVDLGSRVLCCHHEIMLVQGRTRFKVFYPHTLQNLRGLMLLSLDSNVMHGSIPDWIGALTVLQLLSLAGFRGGCVSARLQL